ncbi:MAG: hypothetical protein NC432_09410 [Roseburia sp.]|nr:hypothetical protein [Roseburia sp.]MCM1097032.1 hypothetical protein [Ruminococcus flavefaciens]
MKRAGSFKFWTATVILVLIAALFVGGTVKSGTNPDLAELEGYYGGLEEQLVKDMRVCLDERGLADSGVMLTRIVDADGSREYTIAVHHRNIGGMTAVEREELKAALEKLAFEGENCEFRCELSFGL